MADIRNEYLKHLDNTAPDMDKLWARIESSIDEKENKSTETGYEKKRQEIKKSGTGFKIAGAAAALILVVAGARMFANTGSDIKQSAKDSTVNDVTVKENTQEAAPQTENEDDRTDFESDEVNNVHNEEAAGDTEVPDIEEQFMESEDMAEEIPRTDSVKTVRLSYSELKLSPTPSIAYVREYASKGDEYFVEDDVLEKTDYFADITVQEAKLTSEGGSYVLEVNAIYDKSGTAQETSITLNSTTPYILQENREYFIPLSYDEGTWSLVFENAPQIELTLDGGVVFQNGWKSLYEGSQDLEKEELSVNDNYYDRMRYCGQNDLQKLLDSWQNE